MNDEVDHYVFMILDAYHQICGLRRLVCSNGIPAADIRSSCLLKMAEESEHNGCGLTIAHVRDLIDKQSIANAFFTFSEKVEEALTSKDAINEAHFCKLVRRWYQAEDEPGISSVDRCLNRLELRRWLLNNVDFGMFPPAGSYVKDIPIILYEGLLTGIERRLQMFPFVRKGAYSVRSVGSLDIENFFGGFQEKLSRSPLSCFAHFPFRPES